MRPTKHEPVRLLILSNAAEAASLLPRLETECLASVVLATSIGDGLPWLHREAFRLVLLEEAVMQASSAELDAIYEAAAGAALLEINFAMTRPGRLIRQVQSALHRQRLEERRARASAVRELRDELGSAASGLLLQAQLLASQPGALSREDLTEIVERAEALSHLLRDDGPRADDRICIP